MHSCTPRSRRCAQACSLCVQSDIVRLNMSAVPVILDPVAWLEEQDRLLAAADPTDTSAPRAVSHTSPPTPPEAVVGRVQRVGEKAHGLVPWQGAYLLLDSDNGALVALDLTGAAEGEGFRLVRLWKAPEQGV